MEGPLLNDAQFKAKELFAATATAPAHLTQSE